MAASGDIGKSGGETRECRVIGRQPEAQQVTGPIEAAAPDVPMRQRRVNLFGPRMPRETEQQGSSDDFKSGFRQHLVQLVRLLGEKVAGPFGPDLIAQRSRADLQRRAGTGPRPQRLRYSFNDRGSSDGEAETKSRKPIELSERPENDDRQVGRQSDRADGGIDIRKGFVDHQPSAPPADLHRDGGDRFGIGDSSIRIVRIDDDGVDGSSGQIAVIGRSDNVMARIPPRLGMLVVGRSEDRDRSARREIRQPLNDGLRSGRGSDLDAGRNGVGSPRGIAQRLLIGARRQTLPRLLGNIRNRPRPRIDAGGKVEPRLRRSAVTRHRFREIATVFHPGVMPSSAGRREGKWRACAMLLLALGLTEPQRQAQAEELPRVASINLCTDQLLATLADPAQIVGLSPYARDPARSWDAAKAAAFPQLSGEAEDVLILKPDVVVAGRFTKRATRELLKDKGLRVAEFDPARSLDDVKKQLRQMAVLVKHPERADAEIAKIDAAIARARQIASRKPYRVLAVSRRGWVSGGDNLTTSLLAAVGLTNAGGELGLKAGGYASLEAIITLKPDFLLVSESSDFAEDEGRAFLLHPALERFYPPSKRMVIPERLVNCGGPTLTAALDRLTSELERVDH